MKDLEAKKKGLRDAGHGMLVSIMVGHREPHEADPNEPQQAGPRLAQNDMVSAETKQAHDVLNSAEVNPHINPDGSMETNEQRMMREAIEERKKNFKFVPDKK